MRTKTFRIFVSSTFADLKEERNALQERVFPRLKEYCLLHGTRFQAIDLRWGVSEEAGLDQQTINICLDEIARCRRTSPRPNFIVLLGDRYGWQPPPPQIPASEFEEIRQRLSPEERESLERWYLIDENAVPPLLYLRPREDRFRNADVWMPIERELREILERAVRDMPLESFDRMKYEASATEQEIDRGALRVEEDHVSCFFRSIEGLPPDATARGFIDVDRHGRRDVTAVERLEELKRRLRNLLPDNYHEYRARWLGFDTDTDKSPITLDHIDQLCDDVYERLIGIIRQEIERIEEIDRVEREVGAHAHFAGERSRNFVGRADVLDRIARYVDAPDGKPLVVYGSSGSGKSALMARAALLCEEARSASVVLRFIGATPESSSGRALLDGIVRQVSRLYGGDEATVPSEFRELATDLPERLASASTDRPLVLFIDALDQLSADDGARSLTWLPSDLPPGVGIVVSTLPGEMLTTLESRIPEAALVQVGRMKGSEGAALLDRWLEEVGRTLQKHQFAEVLEKFESERLPLWLKLAFEEARKWRSSAGFPEIELPVTIPTIIRAKLFNRLDDEENHGHVIVSRSLAYLAASKNGLSEDEMLDVLSFGGREGPVLTDFRSRSPESPVVDRLPVVVWSRLYFDLEPYVTERTADQTSLMTFYHRQLAEAVREEYLSGNDRLDRHRELADYFGWQPLMMGDEASTPNLRQMSELPYQQTKGELWKSVFQTLTNFYFLEKKAMHAGVVESEDERGNSVKTYTGIYQVRDDYALVLSEMPEGRGGRERRRRIIVTALDFGDGPTIRCPFCREAHPFDDAWRGLDIGCPNDACRGPLKVNDFVVQRA